MTKKPHDDEAGRAWLGSARTVVPPTQITTHDNDRHSDV